MQPSSDLSNVTQSSDTRPVTPTPGPKLSTQSQITGDSPASGTGTTVLDHNESQDSVDLESKSSLTAVSLQAYTSGTELSGLNDSTEPVDDMPEERSGIPEKIR